MSSADKLEALDDIVVAAVVGALADVTAAATAEFWRKGSVALTLGSSWGDA